MRKNKKIWIVIGILIFLQFVFPIILGNYIEESLSYPSKGYFMSFDEKEDITTEPFLSCFSASNRSTHILHNWISIGGCSDKFGKFKIKNTTKEWFGLESYLKYQNGTVTANLSGKLFYADESNNYTLTIPLEFEDGTETILKVKLHVEYIDRNYWLLYLLIFSPTILLILILIIRKLRKRK